MAIEEDWIDIWGRELLRELPGFAHRRVGPEYCKCLCFGSLCRQPLQPLEVTQYEEECQYPEDIGVGACVTSV